MKGLRVDRGVRGTWRDDRAVMVAMELGKECCFRNNIILEN